MSFCWDEESLMLSSPLIVPEENPRPQNPFTMAFLSQSCASGRNPEIVR
jgi:hypothetical protein